MKNCDWNQTQALQNIKQSANQSTRDIRRVTLSSTNRLQYVSEQNKVSYNLYPRLY